MKKYKINRTDKENLPSDETIEKFKSFSKFQVSYDEALKRNKKPLYKNPKMFLFLVIIALAAYFIATEFGKESANEEEAPVETTE
jgi:hypothetical protein